MKIALLALHFAEYAGRLALALSARHEVLLVLNKKNASQELPEDLRVRLSRSVALRLLELPRLRDPRLLAVNLAILRILRDFSPEILHVQEYHPAFTGSAMLSLRRRVPVVLTVHDHIQHSGGLPRDGWKWKVVQWFRLKASRVIVHGPRMQAELHELDRRIAGRTDVIPHGILGRGDIDGDIPGCEPGTFLFFGRIHPYKGLGYLLDAGDILRRRGRDFRLIVAGTGHDLEQHRGRIAAAHWVELIDRYIPVREVPGLFRRALGVILPYTDATQSGVGSMAFAYSRPVIASRVGDVPEVVIDGRTGLLVPPRDARALADAMERLLTDRALRDSLAAGAAGFARENLSWARIGQATCDTYRRALHSRGLRTGGPQPDEWRQRPPSHSEQGRPMERRRSG